ARWGEYINGGKQLMAQSCCGGRASLDASRLLEESKGQGPVAIRYLGDERGNQAFAGNVTGQTYIFEGGAVTEVHPPDAPGFLERNLFFALVDERPAPPAREGVAAPAGARAPLIAHDERQTPAPATRAPRHVASEPEPQAARAKTVDDLPDDMKVK